MDLGELCFHLRHRRRMYLPDDRYVSAVAFVTGFDVALDGVPLHDFHDWVCQRVLGRHTGMHWSYVVASTEVPEALTGGVRLDDISGEVQLVLIDRMVTLLEAYRAGECAGA